MRLTWFEILVVRLMKYEIGGVLKPECCWEKCRKVLSAKRP